MNFAEFGDVQFDKTILFSHWFSKYLSKFDVL